MKTIDLEIALMELFDIRKNIIVPNVSFGIKRWSEGLKPLHECDILSLTKSGYATEIEIKISKSDLLKDKEKNHNHESNFIKYLYFCVPENLKDIALDEIPDRAGLFIAEKNNRGRLVLTCVKGAKVNNNAVKWNDQEIHALKRLGCMRILGLKKKISKNE